MAGISAKVMESSGKDFKTRKNDKCFEDGFEIQRAKLSGTA